jgi:hypothetical protein
MRLSVIVLVFALLTGLPATAAEPADPFDAGYEQARRNEVSGDGYDEKLGRYFQEEAPGIQDRLGQCLDANGGQGSVHGYFEFDAGEGYRLVLRPGTPFAACLSSAFAGYAPPPPPRRPYVHAFSFSAEAPPAAE